MSGFDVTLRALAHVLDIRDGAEVLVPVVLGSLLRSGESLLEALHLHELRCRFGQHSSGFVGAAVAPLDIATLGFATGRAGLACIHAKSLLKTKTSPSLPSPV